MTVNYTYEIECKVCNGTGKDPYFVLCTKCEESKSRGLSECPHCDDEHNMNHVCRRCDGDGVMNRDGDVDTSQHGKESVILDERVNHDGAHIVVSMKKDKFEQKCGAEKCPYEELRSVTNPEEARRLRSGQDITEDEAIAHYEQHGPAFAEQLKKIKAERESVK